jgi:serine/threonine protein kinase
MSSAATARPYHRTAGEEPLPGYVLTEPLGRGGFGEVWKCEVPGGLQKAVKFVSPDPELTGGTGAHALRQEFEAFQTIKLIRHPFLLQLERVELVGGELVMVMELADEHLADRFAACRAAGLPGIPRSELLGYLADAAEALDLISSRHGLAHLDIKPANLFIVCGRAKVGDYGLVARLGRAGSADDPGGGLTNRGLTPRYVAPEVLRGQIDARSDQYSLALVYQELLTGTFPYTARNPAQMMMMHVSGRPDLSGLPEADREAVGRALAKGPDERYPSSLALVQALMAAGMPRAVGETVARPTDTMVEMVRRARLDPTASASDLALPLPDRLSGPLPPPPDRRPVPPAFGAPPPAFGAPPRPAATQPVPGSMAYRTGPPPIDRVGSATQPAAPLPPLTTVARKPAGFAFPAAPPPPPPPPAIEEPLELLVAAEPPRPRVAEVRSVVPVAVLTGEQTEIGPPGLWADQLVDAVLSAAAGGPPPRGATDPIRRPDGSWVCRFPTTLLASVVPLKLQPLLEEEWFDELDQPGPGAFVLRRYAATGVWGKLSGKKSGMEVVLRWPGRQGSGEVEVAVRLFGTPDPTFRRAADEAVPGVMAEVRGAVCNFDERRKHPRVGCDLPVRLFPLDDQLTVSPAIGGRCKDVSAGGLCVVAREPLPGRYAFAVFDLPGPVAGLGILVRVTRALTTADGHVIGGRFRTDM